MEVKIVNKHTSNLRGVYIGRPSILGNPFSLVRYDRTKSVQLYTEWLREQWLVNEKVKKELLRLALMCKREGMVRLICWCKPKACHGDIVKMAIINIIEKGLV